MRSRRSQNAASAPPRQRAPSLTDKRVTHSCLQPQRAARRCPRRRRMHPLAGRPAHGAGRTGSAPARTLRASSQGSTHPRQRCTSRRECARAVRRRHEAVLARAPWQARAHVPTCTSRCPPTCASRLQCCSLARSRQSPQSWHRPALCRVSRAAGRRAVGRRARCACLCVEQEVGGRDVAVDDVAVLVQVVQPLQYLRAARSARAAR